MKGRIPKAGPRSFRPRAGPLSNPFLGLGGASVPLAVKYNGGKELHDGTGHLPMDADGYYLSRTTGERLSVDAGYAVGDAVGTARLRDANGSAPSAVAAGMPDGERANAVSGMASTSDYFANNTGTVLGDDPNEWTFMMWCDRTYSGTIDTAADLNGQNAGNQPGPRAFVQAQSSYNGLRMRLRDATSPVVDVTSRASNTPGGTQPVAMAFTVNRATGNYKLRTYDNGVFILENAGNATLTGVPWTGGAAIGGTADGANVLDAARQTGIRWALWGSELSAAECDAAMAKGADAFGEDANHFWDGMECGAYDPAAPATLFTLSGAGADVLVEQP